MCRMKFICIFLIAIFCCFSINNNVNCARILGVFPYHSKSHTILGQALFTELAKRGHDVVYISPFPMKNPPENYTDIVLTEEKLYEAFEEEMNGTFEVTDLNPVFMLEAWAINSERLSYYTLIDKAVQELLNDKSQKFDLVILDLLFNEALLGFGPHFNAPIIVISTIGQINYVNDAMFNPIILSTMPHPFFAFSDRMTFSQRFKNIYTSWIEMYMLRKHQFPRQRAVYEKFFKTDKTMDDAFRDSVSLALLNTHFTLNFPIPYLPNLIEIGGFHVKEQTNPLPADIKEFIESAEHGVVYFSLGGNLKPSLMHEQKKKDIIASLSKLKQKILWKWDDDSVKVDRSKFLVRKYFPQDDILAHPNVKLFVTHAGLLSCTESIIRGVPVVGIPIFGDQMLNIARAEIQGWGVQVTYTNLTEKSFSWALNEVLNNKKYQENVKIIAKRFKDQPETPMERAIFWTEYVIRNNGAEFMKTASKNLTFIEYHNLDVYFLFLSILILVILIPAIAIWKIIRFFKKPTKTQIQNKQKRN